MVIVQKFELEISTDLNVLEYEEFKSSYIWFYVRQTACLLGHSPLRLLVGALIASFSA